ncbi:hypothetical protein CYY_005756 [Polysphondylium violaceum]|uniref:E3 ubiquitin-protein ligase n=1 Tax=Polysphondylium violaceum TaxID=133409 RepID=A0A8J4PUK0_9MYCE|nr:hypothetical protein CYY_005756 [Polysphondylium violaceum]
MTISPDKVFKDYVGYTVEEFLDKYPSTNTLKCQYESRIHKNLVSCCLDCGITSDHCFCMKCFFAGDHIKDNHRFVIEKSYGYSCDCGNRNSIKETSFCKDHNNANEQSRDEVYFNIPGDLYQRLTDFFVFIFTHIRQHAIVNIDDDVVIDDTTVDVDDDDDYDDEDAGDDTQRELRDIFNDILNGHNNIHNAVNDAMNHDSLHLFQVDEQEIDRLVNKHLSERKQSFAPFVKDLTEWLVNLSTKSSQVIYIIAEVITNTKISTFREFINQDCSSPSNDVTATSFLSFLFDNEAFLITYFKHFIVVLIDHCQLFKSMLFQLLYSKNYLLDFDHSFSIHFIQSVYSFYYGLGPTMVPFASASVPSKNYIRNLFSILNQTVDIILDSRALTSVPESKTFLLNPNIAAVSTLIRENKSVAEVFLNNDDLGLVELWIQLLVKCHSITNAFANVGGQSFIFLGEIELKSIEILKNLIRYCPSSKNRLLKLVVNAIKTTRVLSLNDNQPSLFDMDSFLDNFSSSLPVYSYTMPLYRMLVVLLVEGQDQPIVPSQETLPFDNREMVLIMADIVVFSVQRHHELYNIESNELISKFSSLTKLFDYGFLQVALISLGPKMFLHAYKKMFYPLSSRNIDETFLRPLIATLETRPEFKPSAQMLRYHLVHAYLTDTVEKDDIAGISKLYPDLQLSEYNKVVTELLAIKDTKSIFLQEYDPYYAYFTDSLRITNLDKLQSMWLKFKPSDKESTFKLPYLAIVPLKPSFAALNQVYNDPSLFFLLVQYFIDPKPNVTTQEIMHLFVRSIQVFNSTTYPQLPDSTKQQLNLSIQEYFELETSQREFYQGFNQFGSLTIISLIKYYDLASFLPDKLEESKTSALELFFTLWKSINDSDLNYDKRELMTYIFNWLLEFNKPVFTKLFSQNNIDLCQDIQDPLPSSHSTTNQDQKKTIQQKQQELVEKMKEQQKLFLQNYGGQDDDEDDDDYQEDEEDDKDFDSSDLIHTDDNTLDKDSKEDRQQHTISPDLKDTKRDNCVICHSNHPKDGTLYALAYNFNSSLLKTMQVRQCESILKNEDIRKQYRKHISSQLHLAKEPNFFAEYPDELEDFTSFPQKFFKDPSNYISSCYHNVHWKCYDVKTQKLCPLCFTPSNILLPIDYAAKNIGKDVTLFYNSLLRPTPTMVPAVAERYIWRFLIHNIEILELKSRKTGIYCDPNDPNDKPYFAMTSNAFKKEMSTTYSLYSALMLSSVNDKLNIKETDPFNYFKSDPFQVFSFEGYSCKDHFSLASLKSSVEHQLFNIFIHHYNSTGYDHGYDHSTLVSFYNHLISTPFTDSIKSQFENMFLPFLRKLALFHDIVYRQSNMELEELTHFTLLVKKVLGKLLGGIEINDFESLFKQLFNQDLFKEFCDQHYSIDDTIIPTDYQIVSSFIHIPNLLTDLFKTHFKESLCPSCDDINEIICLICGKLHCKNFQLVDCNHICISRSPQVGYYIWKNIPVIAKDDYEIEVVTFLYLDQDGKYTPNLQSNQFLSYRGLKKYYQNYLS